MAKCVIIGAGPAGMSAALYLKRAGIDVLIIEKDIPGGEMLKTNKIENYLGFTEIDGGELALKMNAQLKNLGISIVKDKVLKVSKEDKFKIETEKDMIVADYVIVATGRVPRKLGLEDEDKLLNRGISYCAVCDGAFYRNLDVAVIGGGDSAFASHNHQYTGRKRITVHNRLNVGEAVILVRQAGGQEFIVLSRVNKHTNLSGQWG